MASLKKNKGNKKPCALETQGLKDFYKPYLAAVALLASLAKRDFLRAAVFQWITFFLAALSMQEAALFKSSFSVAAFVVAEAFTALVAKRTFLVKPLFSEVLFSAWRCALMALVCLPVFSFAI